MRRTLLRYEVFYETAVLGSYTTFNVATDLDRAPSADALIQVGVTGTPESGDSVELLNNSTVAETVALTAEANGVYYSQNQYQSSEIDHVRINASGVGVSQVDIYQCGRTRELISQRVSRNQHIYTSPLIPANGDLERVPAGEIVDADQFNLYLMPRYKDVPLAKGDWLQAGGGELYRIEFLQVFPDGHKQMRVQRADNS